MAAPPYNVQRTRLEVALCVGILAVYLYKVGRLPTGATDPRAAVLRGRMVACQRVARWFGEQAIEAELAYRRAVGV